MPSNATETIDARILRLIGLEDVFDLDYDTYLTLLKEAMVKGRMPKTTIPSEEVELLTNEWKRVKSKKDKGRFKVKKTKITATSLKIGSIKGKITGVNASKLLPAAIPAAKEGGSGGFNIGESFSKIAESVTSIANTLRQKKKLLGKEGAFDRRAEETEKRKLQKQNLKKRFAKMGAVAQKIMKPVQSLLDKMINYFLMIFLGRVVIKLIDWFSDKKNQGKVKTIFRFISDWWPALLGGFLLFGTGLGGLIANLVPMVVGWTFKLAAVIAKHPLLMLALTGGLAAAKIASDSQKASERVIDEEEKKTGKPLTKKEQTDLLTQKQSNPSTGGMLIPSLVEQQVDKPVEDQSDKKIFGLIPYPKPGSLVSGHSNGGWMVPGSGSGDIIDAKLEPGEFVVNKPTVDAVGVDHLLAQNSLYGGPNANKPKIMGGTMFARTGGIVGEESGSRKIPSWKDVGGEVLKGLGDIGLPDFGNYGLSGADNQLGWNRGADGGGVGIGGGILSNLNKEGAKLHGLVTRGKYGLDGGADRGNSRNWIQSLISSTVNGDGEGLQKFGQDLLSNIDVEGLEKGAKGFLPGLMDWVGSKKQAWKDWKPISDDFMFPFEKQAIERERKLGLMEPGADSLTPETRKKLKDHDNYIRGLSGLRKDVENKGMIPDPFMLLKTEAVENLVKDKTGISNFGSKVNGLQMALKGLMGPLGRPFRIDDMGAVGRYLKPAMEYAQAKGHSSIGRDSFGGEMYDKLVSDKLSNLNLGQVSFKVGPDGRAITSDVYDSNQTVAHYTKVAKDGFRNKDIGGIFEGLAGVLRANQNTFWGNLRPMGLDIDLGGGYKQTDERGNVLTPEQISTQQKPKAAPPPPSSMIDWMEQNTEIKNALAAGTDFVPDPGLSPFAPQVPSYFSSPPSIGLPAGNTDKMSVLGLPGY